MCLILKLSCFISSGKLSFNFYGIEILKTMEKSYDNFVCTHSGRDILKIPKLCDVYLTFRRVKARGKRHMTSPGDKINLLVTP